MRAQSVMFFDARLSWQGMVKLYKGSIFVITETQFVIKSQVIDGLIDRVMWTTCHMLSCVVWSQSLARRSKVVKSPGHLVVGQS